MKLGLKKVALFPGVKRIFSWSSLEVASSVSQLVSWERTGLCTDTGLENQWLFWACFGLVWACFGLFWTCFGFIFGGGEVQKCLFC